MIAAVPPIVERAARLAARDHREIVGYRVEQRSHYAAGFIHGDSDVVLAVAFEGDRLLKVRVLRDVQNGRPASAADRAAIERQIAAANPADGFAVPFDARHFGEYRFTGAGPSTVAFHSLVRDARHGDGTFTVDAAGDVVQMTYVPDVLPKYATGGTVEERRAPVLPGFWATVREVQRYVGHYGPLHGSATVTSEESGFVRYATPAAAVAAVASSEGEAGVRR
ncbi:MAG: hypothetical protein ACYDG0_10640 [Vulcanimicrobiaceae bacterium]